MQTRMLLDTIRHSLPEEQDVRMSPGGRGLMFIFTPRMRINKRDGFWWLDLGYGASKLPHDTWLKAVRHAEFIHRIRTEP